MDKIKRAYSDFLRKRQEQDLVRTLIPMTPLSARECAVGGTNYINFSSNDYLGLSHHPKLIARQKEFADRYGAGCGASRLVTGNIEAFEALEHKIASFKGVEAALVMVSGYQANVSILPALFNKDVLGVQPLVFADKLNHASMHAGCAAAGISQIRYAHNDMNHLESLLQKHAQQQAPQFILTESVFSMDGDIAPLPDIFLLAEKYGAFTIVDDAHATGILGAGGKGLAQGADVIIGTFGKAMGSFGAYAACSKKIRDYLVNACGGLIYATALPPAVLGGIDAALDIVPGMEKERAEVQQKAARIRSQLRDSGYDCLQSATQIIPVLCGEAESANQVCQFLKGQGLWTTAIRPPTVPVHAARLRVAINAGHSAEDLQKLYSSLALFQNRDAA